MHIFHQAAVVSFPLIYVLNKMIMSNNSLHLADLFQINVTIFAQQLVLNLIILNIHMSWQPMSR